jgi:hypothetical protein
MSGIGSLKDLSNIIAHEVLKSYKKESKLIIIIDPQQPGDTMDVRFIQGPVATAINSIFNILQKEIGIDETISEKVEMDMNS